MEGRATLGVGGDRFDSSQNLSKNLSGREEELMLFLSLAKEIALIRHIPCAQRVNSKHGYINGEK